LTDCRPPQFDLDVLHDLAGDKVFERGVAYHQAGQVEILSVEPRRVVARVAGTEDYRSVLTGAGSDIDGTCSCPAFSDWGFCKHLVAVALTMNDSGERDFLVGDAVLDKVRRYLLARPIDSLVTLILDLAERDGTLLGRLELDAATASDDDDVLLARFRKAIDKAAETDGYVHYREASGWAADVETVLDNIAALVDQGRAAAALELVDRAISRIEEAIEEVDDSDGQCTDLLGRAQEIHLAACRIARPDPVRLGEDLYMREVEGEWSTFSGSAERYADVLGDAGLAEMRRLASTAWEKMPPLLGGRRAKDDFASIRSSVEALMDFFAARDGDTDARIAIRAKDLSTPWRYLTLAQFCLSQGREGEALRFAEEGLWLFEDDPPDERLVTFAADLNLRLGRTKEAESLLWQAFERRPSIDLYQRVRRIGGDAARDRAIASLTARLATAEPATRWSSPADLLIHVLMAEAMLDDAWTAVRRFGATQGLQATLAGASEATHPREALAVYASRVEQLVEAGGNRNYEEAGRLIARMACLREASEQATYVGGLKMRFRAKRNFMKLLGR
jgi:uncharacterized Zn finger protein